MVSRKYIMQFNTYVYRPISPLYNFFSDFNPAHTAKCGDPPTINNGDRIWIAGDQANVGTMVTYECDSGFEIEGGSEIACTDSGQWTTPPSCTGSYIYSIKYIP